MDPKSFTHRFNLRNAHHAERDYAECRCIHQSCFDRRQIHWAGCLFLAACLILAGCGPSGPKRYQVTGAVHFREQPVPTGRILFEPNRDAGGDGPRATATIDNGRYQTAPGQGAAAGPYIATIYGFDGVADIHGGAPDGAVLFSPHSEKVDFPAEPSTQNFDMDAGSRN